jgi:hypothetical protein
MGCYNSCIVAGSADTVWQTLRNFHDMSWAPRVVAKLDPGEGKGPSEVGAQRVLNDAFHETLRTVDDEARTLTYSIDDGPAAVSKDNVKSYIATIRVFPVTDTDGAFVEWSSSWTESGGGVAEFCDPIYKALLDSLKSHFA